MNKQTLNRFLWSFLIYCAFITAIQPYALAAGKTEKKRKQIKQKELSTTIVSKNEIPSDGYESLKEWSGITAREKKKRTAQDIERWKKNKNALAAKKKKSKQKLKRLRNIIRRQKLQTNNRKKKFNRNEAIKKAHTENKIKHQKRRIKEIAKRQQAEDVSHDRNMEGRKQTRGEKMLGHVGSAGQALSIIDAAKNAYYEDKDGNIHFSGAQYLKNVGKNLTGIAAVTGTVDATVAANKWAYDKIINDYKAKHKCEKVPESIKKQAEAIAFKWGAAVGTYNGAKCVPILGDMIATGELVEATVGLYHDTAESNRIQAENKVTQKGQGKTALRTLNAKYAEFKACKREFEKLQRNSDQMIKSFKSTRLQYIKVFSSAVKREKSFENGDALLKSAEIAKPYMENNRIESLQLNAKKMSTAVTTTINLAETTLENHATNGGDPNVLKSTSAELAEMMQTLLAYKKECDATTKVLNPLLNGGDILENTKELAAAAEVDSMISGDLYDTAMDTLKAYRALLNRGKLLKLAQARIMKETQRLRFHYFRAGDIETKTSVEIDYRNTLQYQIGDYPIKKLEEKHKTMVFEFNSLRGATQIPEGLTPEIAEDIKKAAKLAPIIRELSDSLDVKIVLVRDMIARLGTQETLPPTKIPEKKTASIAARFGDGDFADMSMNDIAALAAHKPTNYKMKPTEGDAKYGFTFHAQTSDNNRKWDAPESSPIYYGSYSKLLEKGKMSIWADANLNNKKDAGEEKTVPYWIWYDIGSSGVRIHGSDFLLDDLKQAEKRCVDKKWLIGNSRFKDTNVMFGITGYVKEGTVASNSTMDGSAAWPPFESNVRIRVQMQIGGNVWNSDELKKSNFWIVQKDKDKILAKMAFWETGMEKTARDLMNSSLELPKKYTSYLKKHLFLDARVANGVTLSGIPVTRRSKGTGHYYKRSFWVESERKTVTVIPIRAKYSRTVTTREHYRISVRLSFPQEKESLNVFFKRLREQRNRNFRRIYKRHAIKACHVPYSDFALIWQERETRNITNGYGVALRTRHKLNERILILKNNVTVEISVSGSDLLDKNPRLGTMELARKVISKFKKPAVK